MSDGGAVRFRVFKGSKFLFECEIARTDTLPTTLQQQVVRADEFGLLRNVDLLITKRLNLVEVDRMIACCRVHPPQAVATPIVELGATENQIAFEDFATYLKQRERAGVASLSSGVLVLLIPLMGRNNYMQCQIVNTRSTVGEIGAQVSLATPREHPSGAVDTATALANLPANDEDVFIKEEVHSPAVTTASAQQPNTYDFGSQTQPLQPTTAPEPVVQAHMAVASSVVALQRAEASVGQAPEADRPRVDKSEIANNRQDHARHDVEMDDTADISRLAGEEHDGSAPAAATDAEMEMEPEPETDDPYAALRQEYDAFNAFYHHVLLEWSTKPSDTDSASELRRQALL